MVSRFEVETSGVKLLAQEGTVPGVDKVKYEQPDDEPFALLAITLQ
jgi:hypothetical protein